MILTRPILAGGAAAVVLAGAAQLFPPFDGVDDITQMHGEEFVRSQGAFAKLLAEPTSETLAFDHLGLTPDVVSEADDALLLSEPASQCAGRGVYWLRIKPARALAITAPHRGSDRHTGTLAAALFRETNAQAAAWNSAPRRANSQCDHAIDLARAPAHLFSAFALGFADAAPNGLIVQLHGFDGARRDTLIAQEAGMILSNGTDTPSIRLLDLADCLSLAFAPEAVLVYPGDTGELGALNNAQGQLLREAQFDGFVHLEISAELRASLVEDGHMRARLATCLIEAAA